MEIPERSQLSSFPDYDNICTQELGRLTRSGETVVIIESCDSRLSVESCAARDPLTHRYARRHLEDLVELQGIRARGIRHIP